MGFAVHSYLTRWNDNQRFHQGNDPEFRLGSLMQPEAESVCVQGPAKEASLLHRLAKGKQSLPCRDQFERPGIIYKLAQLRFRCSVSTLSLLPFPFLIRIHLIVEF